MLLRGAVAGALVGALLAPTVALAAGPTPTKEQCMSASEDGSSLRKRGKLIAARTSLETCLASGCPSLIRDDCAKALKDVREAVPTVTFKAQEGEAVVYDVQTTMDDALLAERLDGNPIEIDPGEHTFTFTAANHPSQTKKITIKEGEKHTEIVQLGPPPVVAPTESHLVVTSEPGAGIAIDGKPPAFGRFEGQLGIGIHQVQVTKEGRVPVFVNVDTRSDTKLEVMLQPPEKSLLPWILGGAIAVAGLLVGGIALAVSAN